jgi:hypothetical protein
MNRPPLSLALASVLAAQVEGSGRPALLATLHPDFARRLAQPPDGQDAQASQPSGAPASRSSSEMAPVIPLARAVPRPRRALDRTRSDQPDPTPAA